MSTASLPAADATQHLTKPSPAYRRKAWLAMAGLLAFMLLYLLLAGWFFLTAYRLTVGAELNSFGGLMVGGCAAFLGVFMLKALFFRKHSSTDKTLEITAEEQPQLFEFLTQLADAANAPRPHKVYLSARVNAAVFYDLSVLNLIFPSKKNLEIGLGLVNCLNLGELRAVLAHEFGHFGQRAMAVGRWVYVAQQIAGQLIAKRDKLDEFLQGLSRFDIRIAWVGWLLSLIVWSIRSLTDSTFRVVVLMQRALSREMEFQADLVAVALTGSDALVHALHKLQAADDAWDRAVHFALGEKARDRMPADLFTIQTRIQQRMGRILNDPGHGRVPPLPQEKPERHRLFRAELAQAPQMWLSHPHNHEREANAKKQYIAADIDQRSAWELFADAPVLRAKLSGIALNAAPDATPAQTASTETSLQELDKQFEREYLKSRYHGIYFGRALTRHVDAPLRLYRALDPDEENALQLLYPASLAADMQRLRRLEKELPQLRALQDGRMEAPGGVIRFRGKQLQRRHLSKTIAVVEQDLRLLEQEMQSHDALCRSMHLALARKQGNGWPEYLRGLLALVHYAEHSEANLRDAQRYLNNAVSVATATRKVSEDGVGKVMFAAAELQHVLKTCFEQRQEVTLDARLLEQLKVSNWAEAMGKFTLADPERAHLNEWLQAVHGWVDHAAGNYSQLRTRALDALLHAETSLATSLHRQQDLGRAPPPAALPAKYVGFLPEHERELQQRLGWWARFQVADGKLAAAARLLVAGGIVFSVLSFGSMVGNAKLAIYNGLAIPVQIAIGDEHFTVGPVSAVKRDLRVADKYAIKANTMDGKPIETFEAAGAKRFASYVYNVAGAGPLVSWVKGYGNERGAPAHGLGAQRWSALEAEVMFEPPPTSISSKTGGGTRGVIQGLGEVEPMGQLNWVDSDAEKKAVVLAHARWDTTSSVYAVYWQGLAAAYPEYRNLLAERLAQTPDDILLLRMQQDSAGKDAPAVCYVRLQQAQQHLDQPGWSYAAARCQASNADKDAAFLAGRQRWPNNPWFAYAAGYVEAQHAHWQEAATDWDAARHGMPALAAIVATDLARIRRLQGWAAPALQELASKSRQLGFYLEMEGGTAETPELAAYQQLERGQLAQAERSIQADKKSRTRLLRLLAASQGASRELVQSALALLPSDGLDRYTLWPAVALAMREGRDPAALLAVKSAVPEQSARATLVFLEAVRKSGAGLNAEPWLAGLDPESRGQAYGAAVVLLGDKAPRAWREAAGRLLFMTERPYYG